MFVSGFRFGWNVFKRSECLLINTNCIRQVSTCYVRNNANNRERRLNIITRLYVAILSSTEPIPSHHSRSQKKSPTPIRTTTPTNTHHIPITTTTTNTTPTYTRPSTKWTTVNTISIISTRQRLHDHQRFMFRLRRRQPPPPTQPTTRPCRSCASDALDMHSTT